MITATADVEITPIPGSGKALARAPSTRDWVLRRAAEASTALKDSAPVRTGAGRRSIAARAEMGATGWYGVAGWDRQHYYMGILNSRTHWADQAAQRIRYV